MAESTLSLKFTDLCAEVGLFLGYGRGVAYGDPAWTSYQKGVIESCVKSGLRQFYFPPPTDQSLSPYDWSFLKPVHETVLPSGESTLLMPDDFGGFEGDITFASDTAQGVYPVKIVNEGSVRQAFSQSPDATGRPVMAGLQPSKDLKAAGQRWQLYVFPAADQAYTVQFQYYLLADALSGAREFAYGGMAHAETILESCLAIAEQRLDDAATVHTMKFKERLLASIGLDRRFKGQLLGYNRDLSDEAHTRLSRTKPYWDSSITYNGIQY